VLPPQYGDGKRNEKDTYPTVYWTHGFGGNAENIASRAAGIRKMMEENSIPPMIFVMLDE
jgi:hypothetical protein